MQRWDFFGSGPAAAYARQLKGSRSGRPGSLVVRGNQSRRDLTKVAQYELRGQRSQRAIRPGRDDRRMLAIAELGARPKAERFYRPLPRKLSGLTGRTCLLLHFPALRTGLHFH